MDDTADSRRGQMSQMPSRQPEIRAVNDRIRSLTIKLIKADPDGAHVWAHMEARATEMLHDEVEAAQRSVQTRLGRRAKIRRPRA